MGLDIYACSKIRKIPDSEDAHNLWVNESFNVEGQIVSGSYESTEEGFSFRAGSYGGYGQWRQKLSVVAGYKSAEHAWELNSGPFWELIYFSDCEGVIGQEASAKLFNDFNTYIDKAHRELSSYDFETFLNFKKAFKIGKDDGCVVFT